MISRCLITLSLRRPWTKEERIPHLDLSEDRHVEAMWKKKWLLLTTNFGIAFGRQ